MIIYQQAGETVGVLVLVYDQDTRALADKLTDIQHQSRAMSAVKGVRYGQLVPATVGTTLT
jgi:metal-responsive CopG/Arc/MetJ family transcriptional regulator